MEAGPDHSIGELDSASPHVATAAQWLSDEWGKSMGYDLSDTLAWCQELAGAQDETIIAATRDGRLIGTIAVVECDLEGYEHLKPWLSCFYLLPAERGRGIGPPLIQAACDWTERAQHSSLYLYALKGRLTAYYQRFGWQPVSDLNQDGEAFQIMRKPLSGPGPEH